MLDKVEVEVCLIPVWFKRELLRDKEFLLKRIEKESVSSIRLQDQHVMAQCKQENNSVVVDLMVSTMNSIIGKYYCENRTKAFSKFGFNNDEINRVLRKATTNVKDLSTLDMVDHNTNIILQELMQTFPGKMKDYELPQTNTNIASNITQAVSTSAPSITTDKDFRQIVIDGSNVAMW